MLVKTVTKLYDRSIEKISILPRVLLQLGYNNMTVLTFLPWPLSGLQGDEKKPCVAGKQRYFNPCFYFLIQEATKLTSFTRSNIIGSESSIYMQIYVRIVKYFFRLFSFS